MAKKRRQFFHLRYPIPLSRPVYLDELGVQVKMGGVVFTGMGIAALLWLPGQEQVAINGEVPATIEDWVSILQATDNPEIFELDGMGIVKAIHRKSMRAIGGALQWKVWRRDNFRCLYCGVDGDENRPLTVDHFVPIELGGNDLVGNLISACRMCNKRKGSLLPEQFCKMEGDLDYVGLKLYLEGRASALFISHLN